MNNTTQMRELPREWHDGSHWGLSDWYVPLEEAIQTALSAGSAAPPWTTGWYSSKKEIASARISFDGTHLVIEASVSDDFDTAGIGRVERSFTADIEVIRDCVGEAYELAEADRVDNEMYAGFSVGRGGAWEYTYLLPINGGEMLDAPPGDCYHGWGWQENKDEMEIPKDTKRKCEKWARKYILGKTKKERKEFAAGWVIRAWVP
jgi:hypothetical protein